MLLIGGQHESMMNQTTWVRIAAEKEKTEEQQQLTTGTKKPKQKRPED